MLVIRGVEYGTDNFHYEVLTPEGKWKDISIESVRAAEEANTLIYWNPTV